MSITDADRLVAAGRPITLADGSIVRLRFGFRGLLALEESFGSLTAVEEILSQVAEGKGKLLDPLVRLLAAGLVSEGLGFDAVADRLDIARLESYVEALVVALEEALPAAKVGKGATAVVPTNGSLGPTSTTSPPSGSIEATTSSGT